MTLLQSNQSARMRGLFLLERSRTTMFQRRRAPRTVPWYLIDMSNVLIVNVVQMFIQRTDTPGTS